VNPVQRVPYARIDLEIGSHGGRAGKLGICPYAAVFQEDGAESASSVTDYFVPQYQLWSELQKLASLPRDTEVTPQLVEAIGLGCQEIGGDAVARLKFVSGVTLAGPGFAEDVLLRRGFQE
jgi:hypothetical protein